MKNILFKAFLIMVLVTGAASSSMAGVILGVPDFTAQGTVNFNSGTGILSSAQTPLSITYDGVNYTSLISGNLNFSGQLLSTTSNSSLVTGYFGTLGGSTPDFSLTAFDGTQSYLLAGNFQSLSVTGLIGTNSGIAEAIIDLTSISPNLVSYFDGRAGMLSLQFNIVPAFSANSFTSNFSGAAKTDVASVPEPGAMVLVGTGLVGLAWWGRKMAKK